MPVRIGLLAVLAALLLGLVLPATTNASSGTWGFTVLKNSCTTSGGAFGYGKDVLSIEMWENGTSGVAQFSARAVEQVKTGGTWRQEYDWGWAGPKGFDDTLKSHTWTTSPRFDFGASDRGARHRILIRMIFGNYTAYPVGTPSKTGVAC